MTTGQTEGQTNEKDGADSVPSLVGGGHCQAQATKKRPNTCSSAFWGKGGKTKIKIRRGRKIFKERYGLLRKFCRIVVFRRRLQHGGRKEDPSRGKGGAGEGGGKNVKGFPVGGGLRAPKARSLLARGGSNTRVLSPALVMQNNPRGWNNDVCT